MGVVGGHGGDVYWVWHFDSENTAAYCFAEFELAPAKSPCTACEGTGIGWDLSQQTKSVERCLRCHGTAESGGPPIGQPAEIFFACPRCEMGHYAMCRLPPTGGETVFGFAISEPRVYWGCRACVRCKAKLVAPWELRLRC
jgi:hypothetical protein